MKIKNIFCSIKEGTFFHKVYNHIFFNTFKFYLFFIKKNVTNKKIVFCNFFGSGYGDNPKYIAEYILKNNLDYELVWLVDNKKTKIFDFPEKIKIVPYKSYKSVKELATAGIWIDNCRKEYFPSKNKNQLYIQTWHGTFRTKKIEAESVEKLDDFYVNLAKKDSTLIDYLLSSNKKITEQFKNYFWYDGEIVETGCPRDDILFDANAKQSIKDKICNFYKIEKDANILLYVPTFRNSHTLEPYNVDYEKVLSALKMRFGGNWKIITRLHPGMIIFSDKLKLPNYVINATLYPDIQELLCSSDIVLTDYSSMGDYSLYLRPLFMFCTDLEDYKKERGFAVDIESLPFFIAKNNEELEQNILKFDKEKYEEKLLSYYKSEGLCEDGHSCEKVMKLIEEFVRK